MKELAALDIKDSDKTVIGMFPISDITQKVCIATCTKPYFVFTRTV